MDSAHRAHRFEATVRGYPLTIVGRPGVWSWDRLNPGTAALLEAAEIAVTDHVLDLGSGTGVVGAAAAHAASRGQVTLVDCNAAAVACSRLTLAANRIENAEVQLADGCSGLRPASFDLVLCHLPRQRVVQEELLGGAAAVLRPGGALYIVAHRQAGIRTALATARHLLGHCGVVRQRKGYHVAMAVRPPLGGFAIPSPTYHSHTVLVDDVETIVVGKPGVFAWDRLDDGTAALITAMRIAPSEQVLDLGCGTGLAGVAAARRAPEGHVTLLDADLRAAEAAQRTLVANEVDNAEVVLSDLGAELPASTFDVVITNPPFHQDIQTDPTAARRFVTAAQRLLRSSGRLYLVANRFLPYRPWLEAAFDHVAVALSNPRFSVWEATWPQS